jgi:hypothetical protein
MKEAARGARAASAHFAQLNGDSLAELLAKLVRRRLSGHVLPVAAMDSKETAVASGK